MIDGQVRVCVVGDELVAGMGDTKGLGWVGRVAARTHADVPVVFFPLAVPDEISTGLSERWEAEANRRFVPSADNRLVIGLGRADAVAGLSIARSRLNLANMLDACDSRRIPAFVVGPPPLAGAEDGRIVELSAAFADVCGRRRVPYVDTFTPLTAHEQWQADLAVGDGTVPGQAGYGLMAWLVLHNSWHHWLGLPQDS